MQDPDLETARFGILDFSCPGPKLPRALQDIPLLTDARKVEMLAVFAEGYFQALSGLAGEPAKTKEEEDRRSPDPDQPGFFD